LAWEKSCTWTLAREKSSTLLRIFEGCLMKKPLTHYGGTEEPEVQISLVLSASDCCFAWEDLVWRNSEWFLSYSCCCANKFSVQLSCTWFMREWINYNRENVEMVSKQDRLFL
jgi:hypothetical protein